MDKPGEDSKIFAENSKDFRIKKEFERISFYFEDLKENQKSIIMPLIQNAAFMRVTLDDLQEIIAEQGPVEQYMNGANQYGMKQSAALQSYNIVVKNYAAVIKNLFGLLPPEKREEVKIVIPKKETDWAADQINADARTKQINDEISRAAEYQRKMRELEQKIQEADSAEERSRLNDERKALKWN